ncbi:MAG: hypothetical protein ACRCVT_13265 [Leadbetterella sp.]
MKNMYFSLLFKLLIVVIVATHSSFGQSKPLKYGGTENPQIKEMRVAFMTKEISLTEEQSVKFWPLYDKFTLERRDIRKSIRKLNANSKNDSPEKILSNQDQILKLKHQELDLTKSYRDDFLRIISVKQYNDLSKAELEFMKILVKKLKERRAANDD